MCIVNQIVNNINRFPANKRQKISVSRSGFTLVELLIVIAIIAILSAVGFATFTSFTKNARDAKRKADLNFVQGALEQYFADQHYYPKDGSEGCPSAGREDGQLRFGCSLVSPDKSKTYLSTAPQDAIENRTYKYKYVPSNCDNSGAKCTSYCLYVDMENDGNAKPDVSCPPQTGYDFSLTKP